jgi:hypothetical protein
MFMAFSFCKIIQFSFDFGKERAASSVGTLADTPRFKRKLRLDESETIVLEQQESPNSETFIGTPHWPVATEFLRDRPRLRFWYETLFPAISVSGYAVETVVVVLSFFSALAGAAQGLTGAGGPPRIAAFSFMDISKGASRGLTASVFYASLSLLYVNFTFP